MVHIIWILMCPHVRGWSRPQGPWLETTGSVQVQVSRWGREQRGGGQWNAKLLSLSHSYRDDAPELSRLLVGHRISDMTSKYNTQSKPFKLETMVLCRIFQLPSAWWTTNTEESEEDHCGTASRVSKNCGAAAAIWRIDPRLVWWFDGCIGRWIWSLDPPRVGLQLPFVGQQHIYIILGVINKIHSPCSSKYWFRYLMCVVLRLYWRWQF